MFNAESFGAELPENWMEIVEHLNGILEERGYEEGDSEMQETVWEDYWAGRLTDAPEAVTNE